MNFRRISFAFLLLFSLAVLSGAEYPRPKWIHYPEPENIGVGLPRYFWTDVEVPENAVKAQIYYHLDDVGALYVDGQGPIPVTLIPHKFKTALANVADVTNWMAPGSRHRVEFQCTNCGDVGGMICRICFTLADGSFAETFTSEEWRTSTQPSGNGGEALAVTPAIHGDLLHSTWLGAGLDMEPLFSMAEAVQRKGLEEKRKMLMAELKNRLSQETKPTAEVFYQDELPMIRIGDEEFPAIIYSAHHMQNFDSPTYVGSVENFRDAGFRLYVMGLEMKECWTGPGQYDFKKLQDWPYQALLTAPEARILFDIDCRIPPRWWLDAHPEELIHYQTGGEDVSYFTEYGAKFVAPSFASELYKADVMAFLAAAVDYIEAQPWATRVFGYRYDMGVFMEWHYYGMDRCPDDSLPMQRRFRQFLRKKYGTDQALREAWHDNTATLDGAKMATLDERHRTSAGVFYDPVKDIRALDSVRCIVDSTAEFLLMGDHVIKEHCARRCLVGNFYGYFFNMPFAGVGQHFLLEQLLASPDVDFNSQPPPYGAWNREFGEAQYARGITDTYRLHGKLYLMEADTRTHEVPYENTHCFAANPRESVQLMARDFGQALCGRFGFWYFDFGGGWYYNPEIGEYLKKLPSIWNDRTVDTRSAAQVAVVLDMDSVPYHTSDGNSSTMLMCDHLRTALAHSGAPYDTILFSDLENPALPDYQVYVFLNTILCTPERIALAERLRNAGKTLVWCQQAGLLAEGKGASPDTVKALTGFSVEVLWHRPVASPQDAYGNIRSLFYEGHPEVVPLLSILDPQTEVFLRLRNTVVCAGKPNPKGGWSYLATYPLLLPADFHKIFNRAGVHVYCHDETSAIYANRGYLTLHVAKAGTRLLTFPEPRKLVQLLPEYRVLAENALEYALEATERTTYLFRME